MRVGLERLTNMAAKKLFIRGVCMLAVAVPLCGCTTITDYIHNGFEVGPSFSTPPAPVAVNWIDAADPHVKRTEEDLSKWWTVFGDPVLDDLICTAYKQNLTLRQAGERILEARAQLGIAIGEFFPQTQNATGSYTRNQISTKTAESSSTGIGTHRFFSSWTTGFNLAWELDFWGEFRRAIESADASLDASVFDYDDILVTLLSDVATNYVAYRVAEERIAVARDNVKIQQTTLNIAQAQFNQGIVQEVDVDQAKTVLAQTQATIPELEIGLRMATNQLCILMGMPPEDLQAKLGAGKIPKAPAEAALGIPADLLRRRPDVRRAEKTAAAQSAQIGVAEADFYPHISILGTIGLSAQNFQTMFRPGAMTGTVGPSFEWDLLNYGRILNNVRLQDAKFRELVAAYQSTVLNAAQETENGVVTFLKAQQRTAYQEESVKYAEKAVKITLAQYENGTIDLTRVTQLQLLLVQEQDTLALAKGEIPTGLIQIFKGLGGGWQIRVNGCETTPPPGQLGACARSTALCRRCWSRLERLQRKSCQPRPSQRRRGIEHCWGGRRYTKCASGIRQ